MGRGTLNTFMQNIPFRIFLKTIFLALNEILMVVHAQTYRRPQITGDKYSIKRARIGAVCVNWFIHIVINVGYAMFVI